VMVLTVLFLNEQGLTEPLNTYKMFGGNLYTEVSQSATESVNI
jgi:hypothetical protein